MSPAELIKIARNVQANAYCPYSGLSVGAALLTTGGKIYTGANIENASYSLTICAERVALFNAVSAGEKNFCLLAITSSKPGFIYPCGACLQVMAEFGHDLVIIVADELNNYKEFGIDELLPRTFEFKTEK
mgnify:CR=1 FL=1